MNDIISKIEQKTILDWIYKNKHKFVKNEYGPGRKCINLRTVDDYPEIIFTVKKRILEKENITTWEDDPIYGDLVSYHTHGAFVHEHIDLAPPNRNHLRFNLFLSKPLWGGIPVYDGKKIFVEEREYIKYCVNKHFHYSTPVFGFKPRIIISYGISVK